MRFSRNPVKRDKALLHPASRDYGRAKEVFVKKVLLFSVVMVLFCISALLPANADAGSLVFDKMFFYESDYNGVERAQRVYANRFPKSATRYVNGEVNFINYANTDETHKLLLKYYKSDGSLFGEAPYGGVIKSKYEWATTWMSVSLGWNNPNNWPVGQYRVDAYLDGVHVATNYFEVYDDKIASNQKDAVNPEDIVKDWDYATENGNKIYDLYYDKKIIKTQSGTILLNIFLDYTNYGREKYLEKISYTKRIGYILEVNVNLNQYRVLLEMHSDSKGNILSEKKYDNPRWLVSEKGKMSERWMEIAKELSR